MENIENASSEEQIEKYHISNSLTSSLSTDTESSSDYQHKKSFDEDEDDFFNSSANSSFIKDVYEDNFEEAFREINSIKKEYNYIGMDTEFPGVVSFLKNITKDFYYKNMKNNVNSTKLIQLGITLTNNKGEFPEKYKYHTWQFNFRFDQEKDKFSQESLDLLKHNGINFEKLKKNGIKQEDFAQKLLSSGLVLNPHIHWVCYQGSYDFAYLLRLLINDNLPESEDEFMKSINIFFPTFSDVRMMIRDNENLFHGGLSKLIMNLDIERKGINHQAGSDAIATIEAYHKLVENGSIDEIKMKNLRNVLYGLGIGEDNENTIKYININNIEKNRNKNEREKKEKINSTNMINLKQNLMYNNMVMNAQPINTMYYMQQIQNQQQLKNINNMIIYKNINNCFQYALFNSYQQMVRNNFLMNNMKLSKVNA